MSAHVEVVSTDFRRAKVKVSPGTYLVDVLGEACKKMNLKSDNYELKHKQKLVDLTGPFRTSGLSPGAKLELVQKSKSASVVSIALDVNGQRYIKKLPSDMTLWKVMRQFESTEKGLNITAKSVPRGTNSGQLYFEAPVVNIMGREYSALEDLQKTLSQCGISSGSIVLRVTFKSTDQTLFDAMQEIGRYLNDGEQEQQPKAEENTVQVAEEPQGDDAPAENAPEAEPAITEAQPGAPAESSTAPDLMDVDEPPAEASAAADPLQPTDVFSAPSSSVPAATRTREDDSVYEPTIAHAQLRQQQLLKRAQNTRLKSDDELAAIAAQEATRLAKITRVEVKVRFPDQTSAVWVVTTHENASFLYQAIRSVMAHPTQPFKLIIPGPKTTIQESDKRLIATYRLKGRELMHLVWEDSASPAARKEPFLKGSVASKAKEVVVPEVPEGVSYGADEPVAGPSSKKPANSGKEKSLDPEAVKKKLSKFLGLGKK
ncbi:hypothetical protein BT67DRAFT_179049 [Trichocladium antarcticum]|uniref:TUG ubiquitin-like domain-containing protein n=1 Tax=Trichocladium antarcticum TaxID=1450529 RepID=A0AAN6UPP3_9PEZI|nr:hypothetical protein BT67DRAFT_179049 [Trichocladium antarcticum]